MAKEKEDFLIIEVHVLPNSKYEKFVSYSNGVLKVKIASLPVKGEANKYLVKFLSKNLGVSKNQIELISGAQSRNKKLKIYSFSEDDFNTFLESKNIFVE